MQLPSLHSEQSVTQRRIARLHDKVAQAAASARRDPNDILIVASTRTIMADPVIDVVLHGIDHVGEDYLMEGISKKQVVDAKRKVAWHFTGRIVPTKFPLVLENFEWIHLMEKRTSLGSLRQAIKGVSEPRKFLVEVNPLGEKKRLGCDLESLVALIEDMNSISNVAFCGLSCKSELSMTLEDSLRAYEKTAEIFQKLKSQGILNGPSQHLAMGSSRDFSQAIEMGSTIIRVGSTLFGQSAPASSRIVETF